MVLLQLLSSATSFSKPLIPKPLPTNRLLLIASLSAGLSLGLSLDARAQSISPQGFTANEMSTITRQTIERVQAPVVEEAINPVSKSTLQPGVQLRGLPGNLPDIAPAKVEPIAAEASPVVPSQDLALSSQPLGNAALPDKAEALLIPANDEAPKIAQIQQQGRPDADFVPIDLTPVRLPERNNTFNNFETFKASALYRLPGRFFFSNTIENSLRFEVNTFQTNRHYLSDMVYRVMPNITAGWALTKNTRVAANYFFFRDQYDLRNSRLSRNIHSVGGRIDHDIHINEKTMLTLGLFQRALFINTVRQPNIQFHDTIPSLTLTKRVGSTGVVYGSVMGQIRFRDPYSNFQEGDQFYSFGGVFRKGAWNFLGDTTLVTNFGNSNMRFGPNNQVIIMTGEAGRRISRRFPVTAFVRAEPIFNMGANHTPGYAGFNFRIFGGFRTEISKPPIFPIKLKS